MEKALKGTAGLLLAFPDILSDAVIDFDDIYWNDEIDNEVKFLKGLGYSDFVIQSARKKRVSRAKSQKEKKRILEKYEKSIKAYEKSKKKINPLFQEQKEEDKRK